MDGSGEVGAFVVMPDHLQALLKPTALPLRRLLVALRRRVEDKMLVGERHRKPLAHEYFIRPAEPAELPRIARLVTERPVARGLANTCAVWPYSSANPDAARLFRHLILLPTSANKQLGSNSDSDYAVEGLIKQHCLMSKSSLTVVTETNEQVKEQAGREGTFGGARGNEGGGEGAATVRGRDRGLEGAPEVRSAHSPRAGAGAKRVPQRNSLRSRLAGWGREAWKWFRRRLVPWDPDWQPRAEEVRAEFPQRGRMARQGRRAEEYVARWLWLRGHRGLARNVRCREGELDIVVRKGKRLIAVEVRSYVAGGERPSEWLRYGKRRSIWRSIRRFQELRENALGYLEVQVVLAEVQFGDDGRVRSVVLYPLRPVA